ncbi:redox-sensitive transcriptional activator SoxR [Pseudoruegeria sp. SHC-113]|uniref:redox-sensitive transcriptional activator SoxR n=1 Tax=Pseudoruegeria sp. SHC-113 TaxID=2855439 RepID=UPI0021BBB50B|nr:redox-sensitive transcriptional activator SoxR [Pseudoruegeria sp. SHC-113]MCT8160595.1 redox-sensitive transcriptional activator SoxR [Pseudoruegeria sp. SHC-113]
MENSGVQARGLTIGEMAARTGLATSAIRHYESQGLVTPFRNASGQRRFARADIRRLSFVMITQGLGFSLAEIRAALATLPPHRAPNKADWARLSRGFAKELDARIAQMEALRERLDGCIGCGCLSLTDCALYNPKDRIKAKGAGPRYLMGNSARDLDG